MTQYLMKKGAILLFSLFSVITLTFFLMHAAPGDPFSEEQPIAKEIMDALKQHYGLDKPLHVQYLRYLKGVVTGDLGPSYKHEGRTVSQIIESGFPTSFILGMEALFLAIIVGITMGSIAALYRARLPDKIVMIVAVIGISVPSFISATFLQYLFAMKWDLFPVARWGTFSHSILPAISLALLPSAFIARLTRTSMIDTLHSDFVLIARAKGLSPIYILIHHLLRNSIIPVVTYLGPLTISVLTGSFVVEKIFGIPGLGQWFVSSIKNRDYTVIMGLTIFYGALLMVITFTTDLFYSAIDPRIRRTYGSN